MFKNYEINDDPFYLFTCAELKEREKEFIDKSKIERLINAHDMSEFLKILQETHYSKYISEIEKNNSLENVMLNEMQENIAYLRNNLKEEHQILKEFYLLQIDLHNVKLIMKAVELDKDLKEYFIDVNCSYDAMKEAYISQKYDLVDSETAELIDYALKTAEYEKNMRLRELLIEKFYLKKIYEAVYKTGSELIIDLIKHRIDMFNIKNIYRAKYAGDEFDYNIFLYDNGFLSINELKKFEKESIDYFVQSVEKTEYVKMIFQGTHLFNTENTFSAFERNEDEFIMKFFEPVKYSVANIEKIVAFILRKRLELKNLNIMFSGVLYNIDKQKIKNRIAIV